MSCVMNGQNKEPQHYSKVSYPKEASVNKYQYLDIWDIPGIDDFRMKTWNT